MQKRFSLIALAIAVMALPGLVLGAANKLAVGTQDVSTDNTVVVPLEIGNEAYFTAADIPLQFSEGVTLKEVRFENTRVEYFDFKAANIDNENNTVVIGLIHQLSPTKKEYLAEGEGVIANLVFELDDPSTSEVTLDAVEMDEPRHKLAFYYNEVDGAGRPVNIRREDPEFSQVSFSLNGPDGLPDEYALEQNYPNPFNPTTEIAFSLPSAGRVTLEVFNVLGQRVTTLYDGELTAGPHSVTWDGTNSDGSGVSSGVYFYRLSANENDFVETKKMMLLK